MTAMEQLCELFPPERISLGRIAECRAPGMARLTNLLREANRGMAPMELARTIASGIPEALRIGVFEFLIFALDSSGPPVLLLSQGGAVPASDLKSVLKPRIEVILGGEVAGWLDIEAHLETRLPGFTIAQSRGRRQISFDGPLEMSGELRIGDDVIATSGRVTIMPPQSIDFAP